MTGPTPDAGTDDPWAQLLVRAHNEVRASAAPTPSPALPPLVWSETLAAQAQAWAETCQYGFSGTPGVGENAFATTGTGIVPDLVVGYWAGEARDYTYDANRCKSERDCGHYTQLVWRTTERVGCGQAVCTGNSPFGTRPAEWVSVVCQYEPAGNVRDHKPY